MTDRTGHMGNTFPLSGGGVDAVEGVFGDGRASAVRRSAEPSPAPWSTAPGVYTCRCRRLRDPAVLLTDQLKEVFVDGELEIVETASWFPKVARKAT